MNSVIKLLARTGQAALMLAAVSAAPQALALGTASGTSVENLATVDYQVGGVDQLPIESSPGGNSTPDVGNGAPTSFVVDNLVDLTVQEVGGAATPVNPGQGNAVASFTVSNTGNTTQDYALVVTNLTAADPAVHGNADTSDVNTLRAFVDANANGTYEAGTDTAQFIDSLAADTTITVFAVVNVPVGSVNNDVANVRLTATTHDAGSGASSVTTETAGADTAAVDVVFGDAGRDGIEADDDGYVVSAADLTITKTSVLISDPFNGTTDPKAIPGAVIEYTITVNNTGSVAATNVRITDILDANVALVLGAYDGGNADIRIESGTGPALSYCTADGGDADGDNCGLIGGTTLDIDTGLTVGTTGADNPGRILFRVTIQ